MNFTTQINNWYYVNKRNLPWRHNKDPYSVWLSEIILQQTKIQQGLPYYSRFMERYPNVYSLSDAKEQDILKLWEGLGYYSRARNLHKTAKLIVSDHKGIFPTTYSEL
jgi:A/G-specific adenine glycosylase